MSRNRDQVLPSRERQVDFSVCDGLTDREIEGFPKRDSTEP
jgi:hypothetical protein